MPVDESAVREGTRWAFCGKEVEVLEVTPRSVIYSQVDSPIQLVAELDYFLRKACDPALDAYERVVRTFCHGSCGAERPDEVAKAIGYILDRLGPPPQAAQVGFAA